MTSPYKIKTLTPVHIGSGEELLGNYRFVYFPQEKCISVIDDGKVLQAIGEENLGAWISELDNQRSLLGYIQNIRKLNISPEDISQRILPMQGPGPNLQNGQKYHSIREQISSAGRPCIPGSSLKGAIRTAILALYLDEDEDPHFYNKKHNLTNRRKKFDDQNLQKRLIGKDPNHDLFRLLRVGDACFTHSECTLARSVNQKGKYSWSFENRLQQYVEYIPAGEESEVCLSFAHFLEKIASQTKVLSGGSFKDRNASGQKYLLFDGFHPQDLNPDEKLFHYLNQHTKILIENEFAFWDGQRDYPSEVAVYLEKLEEIGEQLDEWIESKHTDQCIIRLGWGTGFKNITGDWQEEKLPKNLVEALKKSFGPRHPSYLPFPKTRRMDYFGVPFGFVHISS
ncbi:MAG: type III-A CRISPR-associated RAMP protein Csm5 [Bacteroidia bacterium]